MERTRQLAAIMFTDIQGYTALMQQNEQKAIASRSKHRNIFNSATKKHNGKILQYYGDGTLSIFDSAIDAVNCAIEMQRGFQQDPAIPVRIGIHTGDIIFSDEEIIGDGVNVASRIESLGIPGSILISGKVYDEIKNQDSINASFLKTVKLKNVDRPLAVYAITNTGLVIPKEQDIISGPGKSSQSFPVDKLKPKPNNKIIIPIAIVAFLIALIFVFLQFAPDSESPADISDKSIAVLPFVNMSNDPEQEYFSDGITEEILNALAQIEGLKVAGRTSSFEFKGKNIDLKTIGKTLNVLTILEGSVQKFGNRIRITAQLINTNDGFHLWSERYDRKLDDIFAIQDDISTRIAEKLKLSYMAKPDDFSSDIPTDNMEAYEMWLKGQYFLAQRAEGVGKALGYFQKAIELDPNYAEAYEGLGLGYHLIASFFAQPSNMVMPKAREAVEKSLSLDNNSANAHLLRARIYFYYDWDWQNAQAEYYKAVELNLETPNMFDAFYQACLNTNFEKAISIAEKVLERQPLNFHTFIDLANFYNWAGRFNEGRDVCKRLLELNPKNGEAVFIIGESYLMQGDIVKALENFRRAASLSEARDWIENIVIPLIQNMDKKEKVDQILSGLEKAASAGHIPIVLMANAYGNNGRFDEAFEWLHRGLKERDYSMVRLKINPYLKLLHSDPRWQELLDKVGFPD